MTCDSVFGKVYLSDNASDILIQTMVTPERITQAVLTLLHDPAGLTAMHQDLRGVRQKLGAPGAPDRAAATILDVLSRCPRHTQS
jgi:lipid A disaccharide synthetase